MRLKSIARASVAAAVAVGSLAAGAVTANAAQNGLPGYGFNAWKDGSHYADAGVSGLGPIGGTQGNWIYCIQGGVNVGDFDGDWQTADNADQQTAAWMIDTTKDDASDLTQAAVAYAIHEHLDVAGNHWSAMKAAGLTNGDIGQVSAKANELWEQAKNKVVTSSGWEQVKYTRGMGEGTIQAELRSENGYVSGVPYTVLYDKSEIEVENPTGVTGDGPIEVKWKALKNGEANIRIQYDVQSLDKLIPATGQHKIRQSDPRTATTDAVEFRVVRSMRPTVTSDATGEYAPGLTVNDVVQAEQGDGLNDAAAIGAEDLDGDGNGDWLTGNDGDNVDITARVTAYGPYTDEEAERLRGSDRTPDPDRKVAEGAVTVNQPGDVRVSTKDGTLEYVDGLTDETLPKGHYAFVWEFRNADQTGIKEQTGSDPVEETKEGAGDGFPFMSDVTDGFIADKEEVETHNMQPNLSSSVSAANANASETVTGPDGKQRPAIQVADDGITYREKGAPLRDQVNIGVEDSNGDGTVDTYDWLHTKAARDAGDYTEDTQAPITVIGEYVATADKAVFDQYSQAAKTDPQTELPEGMSVMATTEFQVSKAGSYLVSDEEGDDPAGVWKAADGVDLDNLPAGYGTFRYRIANEDQQALSDATGVAVSDEYPFQTDTDDGYFADDETVYTRIRFSLDSQASFNRIQLGETTDDKLIIRRMNEADLWPTFERRAVVEGEDDAREKVPIDFHGSLVKLSDDPEYAVSEQSGMPEGANVVHTADIDDVTDWGEYTSDSYTYNEPGTYAWYWTMDPDLKSADHLTDEAWRKLTHELNEHRFGIASEIVRVTGEQPQELQCEVSTKAQGKVTVTTDTADLYDTGYLKGACERAATIEFELWRQNEGDAAQDVKVTTTVKQDIDGRTTIESTHVNQPVKDGDRFYWRELVRDEQGNVIAYGDARVNAETVEVTVDKPVKPLAKTGVTLLAAGVAGLVLAGGAACALVVVKRRKAKTSEGEPSEQ